jgi:hypothetical protein
MGRYSPNQIWQSFAVLLPVMSVGVMGDYRTYAYHLRHSRRSLRRRHGPPTGRRFPMKCSGRSQAGL